MIIAKFLQKIVGKYESNGRPLKKKIGPIQTGSLENCLHREIELKCDLSELWEQFLRHKYDISYALEDNTKLQAKKNKFGHCQDQELFSFTFKTLHLNIVGHEENSTKR